jgi:ligand-binding SRPBCC domain-containing protein
VVIEDRVQYELPLGPLGRIAHALAVRRQLQRIFDYRESAIAGQFPLTGARVAAVPT